MAKSRRQLQREKKEKRIRVLIAMFIVGIMVLSSFAFIVLYYAQPTQNTDFRYSVNEQGIVIASLDDQQIPFYSLPDPGIDIPQETSSLLRNADMLVFAFDPSNEEFLIYTDTIRFDFSEYVDKTQGAVVTQPTSDYPFTVGNCSLATPQAPIILLEQGNQSITLEDSCLRVSAPDSYILYLRDQLLYTYFEVRE